MVASVGIRHHQLGPQGHVLVDVDTIEFLYLRSPSTPQDNGEGQHQRPHGDCQSSSKVVARRVVKDHPHEPRLSYAGGSARKHWWLPLFVVGGRFVEPLEQREVVFDPESGSHLRHELLYAVHGFKRHLRIEVEGRNPPPLSTEAEVIQVTR